MVSISPAALSLSRGRVFHPWDAGYLALPCVTERLTALLCDRLGCPPLPADLEAELNQALVPLPAPRLSLGGCLWSLPPHMHTLSAVRGLYFF